LNARVEVTAAVWAISTLPLSGELQPAHYCHNGVPATLCHVIRPSACPARLCVAQWSPSCRGVLASHTRGLDAYLNRQAQRIDQRHHNLLAFLTQHLQSAPAPAPAAVPAVIDTTDASRSERLLLLLLDQLGVDPEAVQAAWRGEDGWGE
jgi:hypothetical protein